MIVWLKINILDDYNKKERKEDTPCIVFFNLHTAGKYVSRPNLAV